MDTVVEEKTDIEMTPLPKPISFKDLEKMNKEKQEKENKEKT